MSKKTIILHDTFLYKWGGERLILMMAKALWSDLASGFFSRGSFDLRKEWFEGRMIPVSSEIFRKWFRHLKLKYAFYFRTWFLKKYDTVIFSGDSISAVKNCKKEAKKIYYCHTPPRYLYDLNSLYLWKVSFWIRPVYKLAFFLFRYSYEKNIKKMDLILTNSINTQTRIKKYLWLESHILYPPVDMKEFQYISTKDYYLSFARLSTVKRVDKIVEAFKQMPEKKLIVIYWENDPSKQKIFDLAQGNDNIEFITLKNNIWFTDYVGNAIATIYIPIDEDFGMSPVESMSAGKPVIWVDDGGLKESIIHGKTGLLIDKEAHIEDIVSAVKTITAEKALSMRSDCENSASDFSLESFEKRLKGLI